MFRLLPGETFLSLSFNLWSGLSGKVEDVAALL